MREGVHRYRVKFSNENGYEYYNGTIDEIQNTISDKLQSIMQDFLKQNKKGIGHGHEYRIYPFARISDYSNNEQIIMELRMWFAPDNDEDDEYGDVKFITVIAVPKDMKK